MNPTAQREKKNPRPQTEVATKPERDWIAPPVDIWETRDAYILQADMPGVSKNGLEVTLDGNELTLVGRRSPPGHPGTALYRESLSQNFRRVFEIDPTVDTARIEAKMDQGQLTLVLPKQERIKPRKIQIS